MCTAVTYRTRDHYFGRNLDLELSYGEWVTVAPRRYPLRFREEGELSRHFAMLGVAHVAGEYPLYYDAVNEKGLAMAGLNFPDSARYAPPEGEGERIAQFALIPWVLSRCGTVQEAKGLLARLHVTGEAFSAQLPPAPLHWLLADRQEAVTVEPVEGGLRVYDNPVGVLTNEPPFPVQLFALNNYLHLTPEAPRNRFAPALELGPYSYGMGALGLPGDWSSQSRFVRAAFVKENAVCDPSEESAVNQMFHILGSVNQSRGCSETAPGCYETTRYTCCCSLERGIYYYTTYDSRRIRAVALSREDLEGSNLVRYALDHREEIFFRN